MNLLRSKAPLFFTAFAAVLLATMNLFAADWQATGTAIRVKSVAFIDVNVYEISHSMKELPATKSKQAVIDMETGKKFYWTMKRDVDHEKIQNALKEAFAMNGYGDAGKIGAFMGAFKSELKEKSHVTIVYDADKKATTVTVDGGGSATIEGSDFMKAVWSIWFGKIDQPKLGDQLISKLK